MRRIADKDHNSHIRGGTASHRPTAIAPESLLKPLSDQDEYLVQSRQAHVETSLAKAIGRPTYSGKGFILYHGDSNELLPRIAACEPLIHLTVTSPPYNIGKEYEENLDVADYVQWCADWMKQIHAATAREGAFWLNVGYLEVAEKGLCIPIPYLIWDKSPFYLLQEVVWKYGAGVSAKRRLSPRNEKWLFYVTDPSHYTFNLDDIRDPNVKYPNQKRNGKFRCNPLGKNPSDVWEFPKVTTGKNRSSKERTGHPAQFPLAVVERIVRASSNVGDLVLDPFAGSFSTGIAAAGAGRVFIGIELREDYCNLAIERFEEFERQRAAMQEQGKLF